MSELETYNKPGIIEVGIDEAGRGPAFGRVYAGAVIWPSDLVTPLVKDSKKFRNMEDREKSYDFIVENAIAYGIGYSENWEIDKYGIGKAVMFAMHRAISDTKINPDHLLVDGNYFIPYCDQNENYPQFTTVISGDDRYYSIAAASIIAKVEHDRYIIDMCQRYPILNRYELRKNKGYGSRAHLEAVQKYGITQYHRKSFKCCHGVPIQNI